MTKPPHRESIAGSIRIDVGPGELIDKITILEIKRARISTPDKRCHIEDEYRLLIAACENHLPMNDPGLIRLTDALRRVNEALWDIEDEIRRCEAAQNFGPDFIILARAVYLRNDRRAEIKREINHLLDARIFEEKSYAGLG